MFQVWHGPKKGEQNLSFHRNLNVLCVPQNTEKSKPIHLLTVISNTMYYTFHLKFVEAPQFISASPAPLSVISYKLSTHYSSHVLQSLEKNIDALAVPD